MENAEAEEWRTSIVAILRKITGQHAGKKQMTILKMLEAEMQGVAMNWSSPFVCARNTWYEKWSADPTIQKVLAEARQHSIEWRTQHAATHIQKALLIIQESSPQAAQAIVDVMRNGDDQQKRLAAADILNRASAITATKSVGLNMELTAETLSQLMQTANTELEEFKNERIAARSQGNR